MSAVFPDIRKVIKVVGEFGSLDEVIEDMVYLRDAEREVAKRDARIAELEAAYANLRDQFGAASARADEFEKDAEEFEAALQRVWNVCGIADDFVRRDVQELLYGPIATAPDLEEPDPYPAGLGGRHPRPASESNA